MTALSAPLPVHRWTYDEWDEMVASGFFEGRRVELIDGEVIDTSPQMEVHVAGVTRAASGAIESSGRNMEISEYRQRNFRLESRTGLR